MQINGGILTQNPYSKAPALEDKARPPVVIEATAEVDFSKTISAVSATTVVNPVESTDSQQQARFVRTFASIDNGEASSAPPSLPYGVQQYLQVAQPSIESSQRLVDEIV
ncbi:hypothetical protein A9Q78_04470 [Methylophaga sp. 41_12_T18]|nr:hypothetical protein A9Q78_04470 [Methylophaga sp. 41_12_T18]